MPQLSRVILAGFLAMIGGSVPAMNVSYGQSESSSKDKFEGVFGVVLRLDAAVPKEGVTITSETGARIAAPALLGLNRVDNRTYTDRRRPVPTEIHVTWREGEYSRAPEGGRWIGGRLVGDYRVPVAERIPDELLDYIRRNGGALRLKIRLKDDGVLIGWDVEEWYTTKYGRGLRWVRPGGDFREAQIDNGKTTDPGWQK
ncbi:MAG: hypothetical protein JWP36_790 [Paucimonas sp.]|nr:hypothetical protein [Paucimonas sp.]